jgi:tetratricopeptide (TPR) repeat protein
VRGAVAEGTLRGVAQALRLSYQRLPQAGRRAARRLAMLAPNPIPVRLVAGLEPRLRVQLRVRSFVSGVRSGHVEMYGRMHRVLADFLRGEVEDWQREAQEVCDSLVAVFTWDAAPDPSAWPLMNACRPHVEAVIERHGQDPGSVELAVRLIELCRVMGRLLRHLGHPANAVQPVELAVSIARRWLGEDHLTTLLTMGNLAWTLRVDGQLPRALELQERVVGERRRLQGDEHPDSLWAMGNLAMMLFDNGEHGRARSLQEQVLQIGRDTGNPEHPATIWATVSLALIQRDLGELARAQELQEEVVRALMQMLGGDHPHTLSVMASLSQTLRARGDLKRAVALQEQVLETKLRLLTEAHLDTPEAMVDLARTMRAMGQIDRAIELMERAVAIRIRLLGEEHRHTELARRELAELRTRKRT